MQGIDIFIPTEKKVDYLNALLKVGFHTLDFGSFVSPKAIPQMKDTAEVVRELDLTHSNTGLLAIVANERGATEASAFEEITYLGYPFSISPTFLKRNINSTLEEAFSRAEAIQNICLKHEKTLVAYVSMAFGNPYGDEWSEDIALKWIEKLVRSGIEIISLSDTVGMGSPEAIAGLFAKAIASHPEVEFGFHLHTKLRQWEEKINAAYESGCRRFDGVIDGLGGCPMAGDKLVGNVSTRLLLNFFTGKNEPAGLNASMFEMAEQKALELLNDAGRTTTRQARS